MTPVMLSLPSTFLYLTAAPSGSYVSSNVKQDDLLIVLLKVVFPMWTVGHSSLSWKYMFYVYILLPKFSEEEKKLPLCKCFPVYILLLELDWELDRENWVVIRK